MGKLKWIVCVLLVVGAFSACSVNDEIPLSVPCGNPVVENQNVYAATSTSNYTITNVSIERNCLSITISSSGCSGQSWAGSLIAAEEQPPSIPAQRDLRFALTNDEACLAVFERTFMFDISNIRIDDPDLLVLNLEGWNQQIVVN